MSKQDPIIQFKDEEEAQLAAQQFRDLRNVPAWKRIRTFLTEKRKFYEYQLQNNRFKSLNQVERMQDKLHITEQLLNLPDILIEYIRQTGGKEIRFDPYATNTESTLGGEKQFDPYIHADEVDKPKR